MRNRKATGYGRVPARVLLHGEPAGWRSVVVDEDGTERHADLGGPGVLWSENGRDDPEPAWWARRLAEAAEALRRRVEETLTDRTFAELGVESEITWFAVDEPVAWEGLVTLREPDPARFPGRVPPFVVTLEPGRGALLPDASLPFTTLAQDAWTALTAVAERCRTPAPVASFVCGWEGTRTVRVGRGSLSLSTWRGPDGVERIGEIHGGRRPGWGGNPELRVRLDGIDLLDEPARDVITLFRDLGHEVVTRSGLHVLPALGVTLYPPEGTADRFTAAALRDPLADDRHR
ncbi:hypothetical protein Acsp04_12880 [Actinomadura sp. NBRC 104425]|uniref:hypothetical protein n=1 Tax=Actinomadura sp. NBRC 104425 TaxID=3032204 RepID=UPI0024A27986|nr:hypothetical protein [Actinomadura sp. NBRC 104425]GLZ11053.1 hypothetical protein Acsp04_12880 [Actinomadura sp. NBRC 104425]